MVYLYLNIDCTSKFYNMLFVHSYIAYHITNFIFIFLIVLAFTFTLTSFYGHVIRENKKIIFLHKI